MKFNILKITMKSNVVAAMEVPFYVNPLTRLWWTLEVSHILKVFEILESSKFFKLANIAMMQVLGSMEDEQTFSTLSFMKSKMRNRLNEHLHTIVGMYYQIFFHFEHLPIWRVLWWLEGGKT
jgi:hypothetical protein